MDSEGFGMTDKLHVLRNQAQSRGSIISINDSTLSTQNPTQTETERSIGVVLETTDNLSEEINQIEQLIEKITTNHLTIISSIQNEGLRTENQNLHEQVKQKSHRVTNELKRMKESLDREANGPERNSADYRIRKAQYSTLARRFRDVMMKFNQEEEEYREKNKDKIQRQLKIANNNVSDSKLEEILEQDNPQILVQSILGDTSLLQRQRMLNEVQARHMEIRRLEENIRDLHDMFYDLAQLVYEQGELINQIEYNVEHAAGYVERGTKMVRTARDYRSKNRQLKWVICCIVTTISVIIIIIIVAVIAAAVYISNN